ncbi:MAG: hypothetical protein EU547_04345 [Promethearchaeota archaeon]|nr:MAG: hypothetical protein EU547_04345 [Candidatus Lokiarchaeota archaeon]
MALNWNDIESSTMSTAEYLTYLKDKENLKENYRKYSPKKSILNKISQNVSKKNENLNILAIGAEWCKDCVKQVPRMLKIVKSINSNLIHFEILYGIKTNPFHKQGELPWHKERSPPEATDPKFGLEAIPTFYFFNKLGRFLGRIVESPEENNSLEEDILKIIETNL